MAISSKFIANNREEDIVVEASVVVDEELNPGGDQATATATATAAATAATISPPPAPPADADLKYHPDIVDMRLRRKQRTVMVGVVGGVVGMAVCGPIGGVAIGLAGAFGARAVGVHRERLRRNQIKDHQSRK